MQYLASEAHCDDGSLPVVFNTHCSGRIRTQVDRYVAAMAGGQMRAAPDNDDDDACPL